MYEKSPSQVRSSWVLFFRGLVMLSTKIWLYLTRISPFLGLCCLTTLLAIALGFKRTATNSKNVNHDCWFLPQQILACYILLLHVFSIVSPARMLYAIGTVIDRIQAPHTLSITQRSTQTRPQRNNDILLPQPFFVIIIPSYKEDASTLEATLRVLASHTMAADCYHVYLAMEEREAGSITKATTLAALFQRHFYRIDYCIHPLGLPGEVPGKASNENWAFMQACNDHPRSMRRNVIVTTMDADTHLSWRYFAQIRELYETTDEDIRNKTMYIPPLVFDRNLHQIPLLVRLADIMWAGAGISSMYPSSRVCIPTSVYSLPMSLIESIGGWDVDSCAIGEDMHMYLKCFFALKGHLQTEVVYAAASQCNVASPYNGAQGYFACIAARYQQALRHMWGALDTGYAIRSFCQTLRQKRQSDMEEKKQNWHDKDNQQTTIVDWGKILTLFHRLFEAHFLPTHLALILTITSYYTAMNPTFLLSQELQLALKLSSWLRAIGFCLMICYFYRYQHYHRLCVQSRKEEMMAVGLLKPMAQSDDFSNNALPYAGLLEALFFPIAGLIFGAVAALQAVFSHVFTDRLTYVVSLKSVNASQCDSLTEKR